MVWSNASTNDDGVRSVCVWRSINRFRVSTSYVRVNAFNGHFSSFRFANALFFFSVSFILWLFVFPFFSSLIQFDEAKKPNNFCRRRRFLLLLFPCSHTCDSSRGLRLKTPSNAKTNRTNEEKPQNVECVTAIDNKHKWKMCEK